MQGNAIILSRDHSKASMASNTHQPSPCKDHMRVIGPAPLPWGWAPFLPADQSEFWSRDCFCSFFLALTNRAADFGQCHLVGLYVYSNNDSGRSLTMENVWGGHVSGATTDHSPPWMIPKGRLESISAQGGGFLDLNTICP